MSAELTFDGKKFISSRDAARLSGYAADYIGQLCRSGRIDARHIGRNWYISEESIKHHKALNLNSDPAKAARLNGNGKHGATPQLSGHNEPSTHPPITSAETPTTSPSLERKIPSISELLTHAASLPSSQCDSLLSLAGRAAFAKIGTAALSASLVLGAHSFAASSYPQAIAESAPQFFSVSLERAEKAAVLLAARTSLLAGAVRAGTGDFFAGAGRFADDAPRAADEFLAEVGVRAAAAPRAVARGVTENAVAFFHAAERFRADPSAFADDRAIDAKNLLSVWRRGADNVQAHTHNSVRSFAFAVASFAREVEVRGREVVGTRFIAAREHFVSPFSRGLAAVHSASAEFLPQLTDEARGAREAVARAARGAAEDFIAPIRRIARSTYGFVHQGLLRARTLAELSNPAQTIPSPIPSERSTTVSSVSSTTAQGRVIAERIIDRVIVERAVPVAPVPVVLAGVSEREVNAKLTTLHARLAADISALRTTTAAVSQATQQNTTYINNVYQTVAGTNNLDVLNDADLGNPTITYGTMANTELTAVRGSFTSLSGGGLTLSGGQTIGGDLTVYGTITPALIAATSSISSPYFVASSTSATSTFAGGVTVQTDKLVVESGSGNVGLGTTSPKARLALSGYANSLNPLLYISTSTPSATSTALIITSSGNLGLSTTSPTSRLAIEASTPTAAFLLNQTGTGNLLTLEDSGTAVFVVRDGGSVGVGTSTPAQTLSVHGNSYTSGTGFFGGTLTATSSAYLATASSALVGIGTTTPYSRLSVWGGGTGDARLFELTNSASTTLASVLESGTAYLLGSLGLGTTTPSRLLSVQGNSYVSGLSYFGGAITATSTLDITGVITSTATAANVFPYASSTAVSVSGTGYFGTASTTNLTVSSLTTTRIPFLTTAGAFTDDSDLTFTNGNRLTATYASSTALTTTGNAYFATSIANSAVGIGTTTPLNNSFTVSGGKDIFLDNSASLAWWDGGTSNVEIVADDATTLSLTASGYAYINNALYVRGSGGNVGVGTTTPGAKFGVQGNALISGNLSVAGLIATSSTITFSGLGTNMLASINASGNLVATSTPTAAYYLATSSIASILPYASTTALTVSGTGGLYIGTLTGPLQAISGAVTASSTLSTFYGGTGSGLLGANMLLTTSAGGTVVASSTPTAAYYLATSSIASIFPYATTTSISSSQGAWFATSGGNVGVGTTSPGALFAVHGNGLFSNNLSVAGLTATSSVTINSAARTSGSTALLSLTAGADTGLTTLTEANDILFDLARTKTHANGTIALQRDIRINAATHAFTNFAAGLITDLATVGITGAPIVSVGGNATNTNAYSLLIGTSTNSTLLNASTTNSYGLAVYANAGATNNYAAAFLGGNTGFGTTSPSRLLSVHGQCVTADTRLRRRRKKKGAKGNADEDYDYDEVQITDIKEGDEIASLDEKTGRIVWSRVNALMDMGVKPIYKFTTATGKTIRTTGSHPYLVRNTGSGMMNSVPAGKGDMGPAHLGTASEGQLLEKRDSHRLSRPVAAGSLSSAAPEKVGSFNASGFSRVYAFIDLSNVYHGAKEEGWEMDYTALHQYLQSRYGVSRAFIFGGTSNKPDRVRQYEEMSRVGYKVLLVPSRKRDDGTGKADVDSRMTFEMMRLKEEYDKAVIITGDGDFYWVLEYLRVEKTRVWLFGMVKRVARELKKLFGGDFGDISRMREQLALKTHKADAVKQSALAVTDAFDGSATGITTSYINGHFSSSGSVDSVTVKAGRWTKAANIHDGAEIAVQSKDGKTAVWDKVVKIELLPAEQVYDIEVEGTHNFIGNDIVAHNTYLSGNTFIGGDITATSSTITFSGLGTNMLASINNSGNLVATSTPTAAYYLATSSIASIFPYASTTALTVSGTVGLYVGTLTGPLQAISGAVSASSTLSTFYGGTGSGLLGANMLLTTSAGGTVVASSTPTAAYYLATSSIASILPYATTTSISSTQGAWFATSGGSVGIATTSPYGLFSVEQGTETASLWVGNTGSSTPSFVINGVNGDGRIGIGSSTPSELLSVERNGSLYMALKATAGTSQIAGIKLQRGTITDDLDDWNIYNSGGSLYFDSVEGTLGTNTRLFLNDQNGRVGIGTTTPGALLSVHGAGLFSSGLTVGGTLTATSTTLLATVGGNVGIGTTSPGNTFSVQGNGLFSNNLAIAGLTATGTVAVNSAARTSGSTALLSLTAGADTGLTTLTEANDILFDLARTKTHANGTIALQRDIRINAATHAFTNFAAGLITDLATVGITGAPIVSVGGNATNTNAYSLLIGTSTNSTLLNASTTNSYGLAVYANAGAVNNYAAAFLGGNTGFGTTSPSRLLSVHGQCVTGDTRLRRRRTHKKRGKNGEWIEEDYFELVRIDQIKPGDEIETLDERTGRLAARQVKALMDMGVKDIFELKTATGKTIRTTGNHPYLAAPDIQTPRIAVFIDGANFEMSCRECGITQDYAKSLKRILGSRKASIRYYMVDFEHQRQRKFFDFLDMIGFTVVTKLLKVIKASGGKGKNKANFDVEISFDSAMCKDEFDVAVLFSGDSDFVYMVSELQKIGKKVVVISPWFRTATELRLQTDMFVDLRNVGINLNKKGPEGPDKSRLSPALSILDQLYPFVKNGVWIKASQLREGQMIAVRWGGKPVYERVISIIRKPAEQVYDIEVEGTHNFIGNDIVAHNTYLSGNTFIGGDITATSSTITFSGLGTNMLASINNSGNLVATSTPTAAYYLATSTTASILRYASTTALTVSGTEGLYVGTLTGPLQAISGAVSASSTLSTFYGGTGSGLLGTNMILTTSAGGTVVASSTPTAAYYLATSSIASIFPYATTTSISSSQGAWFATSGGNVGVGTTTPGSLFAVHGSGLFSNNLSVAGLTATGTVAVNSAARTTGSTALFSLTGGADTGLTTLTEANDILFDLARTKTHANGTISLQRDIRINAATHAFTNFAAGLITDLATLGITGAPLAGTNATTTNAHTLLLSASSLNASTTNSYGLTVNANTGAGSNYAAAFLGGNTGFGTTSPSRLLSVHGQCVTGDTRLRRRRKRRGSDTDKEHGTDTDDYIYDEVQIKDVKEGDEIASLDERTGTIVWSRVNALMDMGVKPIYKFTTATGKTIRTTGNHPYLVGSDEARDPKRIAVFIDAANLEKSVEKLGWRVHHKHLKGLVSSLGRVVYFGYFTVTPRTGSQRQFLASLARFGYRVVYTKLLKIIKTPKGDLPKADVDAEIITEMMERQNDFDVILLFSGDSDYRYPLQLLQSKGKKVIVVSTRYSISKELLGVADRYVDIGKMRHLVARGQTKSPSFSTGGKSNLATALGSIGRETAYVKGGVWTKAAEIHDGAEIAVQSKDGKTAVWDTVTKVEQLPAEQVYDIEVEGTHNFVAGHYVNAKTKHALTLEQEERFAAWKKTNKNTALLSDVSALRPTEYKYLGTKLVMPHSIHSPHELSMKYTVDNEYLQPVEGLEPSGHKMTSLVPHHATGLHTVYQAQISSAIAELGFDPREVEFGGIVAHNTYLSGNTFIGGDLTASSTTITFSGLGTNMLASINNSGNLVATSTPTAAYYLATSSIASIFPYATTTSISSSQGAWFATSGGNVGIGTTTPSAKFAITGTGATTGRLLSFADSNNIEKVTILDNGNVGVGSSSPLTKLHVTGPAQTFGGYTVHGQFFVSTSDTVAQNKGGAIAIGGRYSTTDVSTLIDFAQISGIKENSTNDNTSGALIFGTANNTDANANERWRITSTGVFQSSGAQTIQTSSGALTVQGGSSGNVLLNPSGGNVGIGTTTPGGKFAVNNTGAGLSMIVSDDTDPDSTPFVIDTAGAVGIGVAAPLHPLHIFVAGAGVGGAIGSTNLLLESNTSNYLSLNGPEAAIQGFVIGIPGQNTDTWMRRRGDQTNNPLEIGVGGTERIDILDNGNVGIGTTSPWGLLSVEQGSTGPVFVVSDQGTSTPSLIVTGSGNVGIGTTVATYKLTIAEGETIGGPLSTSGTPGSLTIRSSDSTTGTNNEGADLLLGSGLGTGNGPSFMSFSTANELGSGTTRQTLTERMRITSTGNVGIGITSPGGALHVSATTTDVTSNPGIVEISSSGSTAQNNGGSLTFGFTTSGGLVQNGAGIAGLKESATQSNSAGYLALYSKPTGANAVERMRIDSTGNVGIGTTSPASLLSVAGTGYFTGNVGVGIASPVASGIQVYVSAASTAADLILTNVGSGSGASNGLELELEGAGANAHLWNYENGYLRFATNNSERMRIDSTGNVGIGTTTPKGTLDVNGSSSGSFQSGAIGIISSNSNTVKNWAIGSGRADNFEDLSFYAANKGADPHTTGTNVLTLGGGSSATGFNIGIGTTSPRALLAVQGSGYISSTLFVGGTLTATSTTLLATVGGNVGIGTTTPGGKFAVNNTGSGLSMIVSDDTDPDSTPFVIDASGNVGIGTAGPIYTLDTNKSVNGDWVARIYNSASDGYGLNVRGGATDGTSSAMEVFNQAATSLMVIKGNGNVGIGTTSPWGLLSVEQGSTGPVFVVSDQGTSSPHLLVSGTGNVGIGTAGPGATLDVGVGTALADANRVNIAGAGASAEVLGLRSGSAAGANLNFYVSADTNRRAVITAPNTGTNGGAIDFYTKADGGGIANQMRITSGGNVGIGTTTPLSLLNVEAASGNAAITLTTRSGPAIAKIVASSAGGGGMQDLYLVGGTDSTQIRNNADGATLVYFKNDGNVGIGTTTPYAKFALHALTGDTQTGPIFDVSSSTPTATTSLMVISRTGNVGIGTTAPVDAKTVIYTLKNTAALSLAQSDADTSSYVELRLSGDAQVANRYAAIREVNDGAANRNELAFLTASVGAPTEKVRIDQDGNVGIGTASPGTTLDVAGKVTARGLRNDETAALFVCIDSTSPAGELATSTVACTGSSRRYKENIEPISYTIADVMKLQPVSFDYKQSFLPGTPHQIGFIAEDMAGVIPEVVSYDSQGLPGGIDYPKLTALLAKGIQDIGQRISLTSAPTSTPSIYIDSAGNIGIGTSTPGYKMEVEGDVAATSFVNISTRDAKKDIAYYDDEDKRTVLEKIKTLGVATYYYKNEACETKAQSTEAQNPNKAQTVQNTNGCSKRLGLIAEETPPEVLSANKKGVDVYKLATFILAGVQEQQKRIESLELRVTKLEMLVGTSTQTNADLTQTYAEKITTVLTGLGVKITNGLAELKAVVVEALTVGNAAKPSGITLYDEVTKEPYCLTISSGQPTSRPGVCNTQSPISNNQTNPNDQNSNTQTGGDTEPPVITVNGNNPAEILKDSVYADLGATVTDNVNQNLGYHTFVNGTLVPQISLDTSSSTTYAIAYVATDGAGNTATSTRTVVVGVGEIGPTSPIAGEATSTPPAEPPVEPASEPTAPAAEETAPVVEATTTPQF